MKSRFFALAALTSLVALAACDDDNIVGVGNIATVRVVNATNVSLDVATNGAVGTGSANLTFGQATSCLVVSATNPDITIRNAGSATVITGLNTNFLAGGKFVIIATAGAGGALQFTTVQDNFLPASGQAGLAALNAFSTTTNVDLYVTAPNAALVTPSAANLTFAVASSYFNVSSGVQQLRFTNAGAQTIVLNAGNTVFNTATNSIVVLGPPAAAQTVPRAFIVPGC
ncbi:MAG TPA: DUF4397 domain-containing protein [Gemmatimonadaceae bacterium]|nr:DUF4397 domain-containing protein [Gemmatimonadaceae bacterium]